jgi:hypothetical protein
MPDAPPLLVEFYRATGDCNFCGASLPSVALVHFDSQAHWNVPKWRQRGSSLPEDRRPQSSTGDDARLTRERFAANRYRQINRLLACSRPHVFTELRSRNDDV